jgi:hypothetical protein
MNQALRLAAIHEAGHATLKCCLTPEQRRHSN